MNTKKSEFVMFPKFRCTENLSLFSVKVASSVVPSEVSARYLGVHFDSGLCWRPHLNVFSQVSKKIGVLRRCSRNLSFYAKRNYNASIVHLGMDCCSLVWSDNSSSVSRRLQLLEKQSIRVLAGRRHFDRTGDLEELCRQFKISSFTLRHNKQLGNLIFKCINGLLSVRVHCESGTM